MNTPSFLSEKSVTIWPICSTHYRQKGVHSLDFNEFCKGGCFEFHLLPVKVHQDTCNVFHSMLRAPRQSWIMTLTTITRWSYSSGVVTVPSVESRITASVASCLTLPRRSTSKSNSIKRSRSLASRSDATVTFNIQLSESRSDHMVYLHP